MELFIKLNEKLPSEILFKIMRFQGGCLPYPSKKKMLILQKHFTKRYCKICGEYKILYSSHRHHPRKKYYYYIPKYQDILKIREMLYISKSNFKIQNCFWENIIMIDFFYFIERCVFYCLRNIANPYLKRSFNGKEKVRKKPQTGH